MNVFPGRLYEENELENTEGLEEVTAISENKCFRCGNTNPAFFGKMSCAYCGQEDCLYCRNCIVMGRMNVCQQLYFQRTMCLPESQKSFLVWNGTLSNGQKKHLMLL